MVVKAELHCHIEGAASTALVAAQAKKYGVDVSGMINGADFVWHDFTSFLGAYDKAAALFRTDEDYALLSQTYFESIAADGAIYGEIFISTNHAQSCGLDPKLYIEGLAEGMRRAKANTGIETRMIATGLRHLGPEGVDEAVRYLIANPHPLITGWGMAGEERVHHPKDFVRSFDMARDAGFGITVHAGELVGWQSVADAVDYLKPDRIGHGVRAIENPDLVKRLADEQIVLECCPGSNISLKVFPDFASHSFLKLRAAGIPVTLNSDDPPYFATSLKREYDEIGAKHFGLSDAELTGITRTAIKAAYVDEDTRRELLAKII
ncbi:MAG: adenosine deaminase [Rhizobiaceae bacterium]